MFRNKQATSKLVSGSLILISLWIQCTFFASVSSTASSSISEYSNNVKSDKERQVSNLPESSTNLTTKRPASDNIKTEATTTQFRFLDDYGELPELTYEDNGDDDDILESVTTEPTTMKILVRHHANEVRASLYQANPATTRIPDYVASNAQALGQDIPDEFVDGSGDVDDTTTIATPTVQGPITATKPPDFDCVANINMSYSLLIFKPFDPKLNDNSSTEYKTLAMDVETLVNQAFSGCPGFRKDSATVFGFRPSKIARSSGKYVLGNPSTLPDGDETWADYSVTFASATVYAQEEEIVNYIARNVTWILESEGVGNYPNYSVSAGGMENSTRSQLTDPCTLMTSSTCTVCSPCYQCTGYDYMKNLNCHYGCDASSQRCTITDNTQVIWEYECTCNDGYIPMAGDCADADVVIGVSVGVGSALIIGLIIAVIILRRKLRKKKDSELSLSEEAPHPYEAPGPQEPSSPSPEPTSHPLVASVEPEPSAPHEPISLGEVVVAQKLEAAAPEPAPSTRSEVIAHDYSEDRNDQPLATIELESHRLYDYDDERDLPPEIAKSTVFRNFIPSLKNIDADDLGKEYAITRPRVSLPPFEAERDVSYNNETFF